MAVQLVEVVKILVKTQRASRLIDWSWALQRCKTLFMTSEWLRKTLICYSVPAVMLEQLHRISFRIWMDCYSTNKLLRQSKPPSNKNKSIFSGFEELKIFPMALRDGVISSCRCEPKYCMRVFIVLLPQHTCVINVSSAYSTRYAIAHNASYMLKLISLQSMNVLIMQSNFVYSS